LQVRGPDLQTPTAPLNSRNKTAILKYLKAFGGASMALSIAVLVLSPFFWFGAVLIYLAAALWIADICVENLSHPNKGILIAVVLLAAGLFTKFVVLFSPQLEVVAHSDRGDYKAGEVIDGISWKPGYSELRVAITNHSGRDYENLDMQILPDAWINEEIQTSHITGCSFPESENGLMSAVAHGTDPVTGKPFDQLLTKGPHNLGVRVRCEKLPNHSSLQILIATIKPDPKSGMIGMIPDFEPASKLLPSSVRIKGDYSITGRPWHVDKTIPTS
jgi:hypothetical protein